MKNSKHIVVEILRKVLDEYQLELKQAELELAEVTALASHLPVVIGKTTLENLPPAWLYEKIPSYDPSTVKGKTDKVLAIEEKLVYLNRAIAAV